MVRLEQSEQNYYGTVMLRFQAGDITNVVVEGSYRGQDVVLRDGKGEQSIKISLN